MGHGPGRQNVPKWHILHCFQTSRALWLAPKEWRKMYSPLAGPNHQWGGPPHRCLGPGQITGQNPDFTTKWHKPAKTRILPQNGTKTTKTGTQTPPRASINGHPEHPNGHPEHPNGHQMAPRTPKWAPNGHQMGTQGSQDSQNGHPGKPGQPKWAPRHPNGHPDTQMGAPRPPKWVLPDPKMGAPRPKWPPRHPNGHPDTLKWAPRDTQNPATCAMQAHLRGARLLTTPCPGTTMPVHRARQSVSPCPAVHTAARNCSPG